MTGPNRGSFSESCAERLRLTPFGVGFKLTPGWTACMVAAILVAAGAPAASSLVTGMIINATASQSNGIAVIGPIVAALVAVFLAGQTAALLVDIVADAYGGRLQRAVEARTMVACADASGTRGDRVWRLVDALRNAVPIRQLVSATSHHVMTRLQAVLAGCLIIFYEPGLGTIVVACFGFCAMLLETEYDEEQSKAYSAAEVSRRPRYLSGMAFDLSAAREVKVFGAADWIIEQYDAAAACAHGDGRIRVRGLVLVSYAAVLASTVALLVAVARDLAQGRLSAGDVAVCVSALLALTGIFAVTMNVVYSSKAASLFTRVKTSGVLRDRDQPKRSAGAMVLPGEGSLIRFENVSYCYPGGEPVFKDLSFEVRLPRSLAVVGANGAGKSTLMRLLTGVVPPDNGSITCDGRPIGTSDEQRSRWRSAFAFLGQQFTRYPATLQQNVLLSSAAEPLHDSARALLADLDSRLLEAPAPLLAQGVRNGIDLSGGQWQRVATARAVQALDPGVCRVIVLDEPTAALDAQAEARFFDEAGALAGERNTTVMVSHRLSGVRKADEILVLDGGRVRERGSHESLMNLQGLYADMFTAQARRYRD